MRRVDLYAECNADGAPVEEFTRGACAHCINPECTRSTYGKSHFDQRVNTWYERLFSDVPRMDPSDPLFQAIAAQNFVAINPPIEVRGDWVDPRNLTQPEPAPAPEPEPSSEPEPEPEVVEPPPEPEPEPPAPEPAPEPAPTPAAAPRNPVSPNLAFTNTPNQPGQMIPNRNQQDTGSSWDAPLPTRETEGVRVVKPGEKVKIGGS
jgi:hypothetical protein